INGIHFNDNDPDPVTNLIIPCSEIFRLYYLLGPRVNREVFSGHWEIKGNDRGVYYENSFKEYEEDGKRKAYIVINDRIPGRDVPDIIRLLSSPFGIRNIKRISAYLRTESHDGKAFIKVNFPYNTTRIKVVGKVFSPSKTNRKYF